MRQFLPVDPKVAPLFNSETNSTLGECISHLFDTEREKITRTNTYTLKMHDKRINRKHLLNHHFIVLCHLSSQIINGTVVRIYNNKKTNTNTMKT